MAAAIFVDVSEILYTTAFANAAIVSASSFSKDFKEKGSDISGASKVGNLIGEKGVNAGIKDVFFDRGKYRYHGRVKALAEGAREAGLIF